MRRLSVGREGGRELGEGCWAEICLVLLLLYLGFRPTSFITHDVMLSYDNLTTCFRPKNNVPRFLAASLKTSRYFLCIFIVILIIKVEGQWDTCHGPMSDKPSSPKEGGREIDPLLLYAHRSLSIRFYFTTSVVVASLYRCSTGDARLSVE